MKAAILSLVVLSAAPAGADWLVLRNGGRIETKGPWKERGRSVVYTALDGKLVSLATTEVNVAASLAASSTAPASRELYRDLGAAPDARQVTAEPEINGLIEWIRDPNAPRVSGTLSVPGLGSSRALAAEGRRLLQNRAATAEALRLEASTISRAYTECLKLAKSDAERGVCQASHQAAQAALASKVALSAAAIDAARAEERAEEERQHAVESQRREEERAIRQQEEELEALASEKQDPPRRR